MLWPECSYSILAISLENEDDSKVERGVKLKVVSCQNSVNNVNLEWNVSEYAVSQVDSEVGRHTYRRRGTQDSYVSVGSVRSEVSRYCGAMLDLWM